MLCGEFEPSTRNRMASGLGNIGDDGLEVGGVVDGFIWGSERQRCGTSQYFTLIGWWEPAWAIYMYIQRLKFAARSSTRIAPSQPAHSTPARPRTSKAGNDRPHSSPPAGPARSSASAGCLSAVAPGPAARWRRTPPAR